MSKRTIATYVRLVHDERPGWKLETPYKVCHIDVRVVGQQPASPDVKELDEEDVTIDEEDLDIMDELEEESPIQEVVETLFLLGNHETGEFDWYHSTELLFLS